jgi:hypothetical protein
MELQELLSRHQEICYALIEASSDDAIELQYELDEIESEIIALGGLVPGGDMFENIEEM